MARHDRADALVAALTAQGIGSRGYYRVPVHRQPPMRQWGGRATLPVTDELAASHLALPMSPVLSREQAAEVVSAVRSADV